MITPTVGVIDVGARRQTDPQAIHVAISTFPITGTSVCKLLKDESDTLETSVL
jgi:hypothetical protein